MKHFFITIVIVCAVLVSGCQSMGEHTQRGAAGGAAAGAVAGGGLSNIFPPPCGEG